MSLFFNFFMLFPIRIISDEKVNPNITRQPHNERHKNNQCNTNCNKISNQTFRSNEKITDYESCNSKSNSQTITHIHRSIKERRFHVIFGVAMRTSVVHFVHISDIIRVLVQIHRFFLTFWTTSC